MKTFYISLIALLLILSKLDAQIPNHNFEEWTTFGNSMTPDGWWSPNDSLGTSATYFQ